MKVVDANVLIYSVDEQSKHHDASRYWIEKTLSGGDTLGLSWIAMLAFVRIMTNKAIYERPLAVSDAVEICEGWITANASVILEPAFDHMRRVRELLEPTGVGGNLINDAHLAALALEARCEVVSFDRDFNKFPVKLVIPSLD